MQQIGGANAVIYFAPVIFEQNLGLGRQLALILGGVNVTVYALAAFASYPLVERMGRRKLFLIGSAGQVSDRRKERAPWLTIDISRPFLCSSSWVASFLDLLK